VGKRRRSAGSGLSRLDGLETKEGEGEAGQHCLDGGIEVIRVVLHFGYS
jgi:hypothetical protein